MDRTEFNQLLANLQKRNSGNVGDTKVKRKAGHKESDLQILCVAWFRSQPKWRSLWSQLVAIGNGGKRIQKTVRDKWGNYHTFSPEAKRMKAEGVTAGVSDLMLPIAGKGGHNLFIEMKTTDKWSRQSDAQKAWQRATERVGNKYVVCRTFEEFKSVVTDYLSDYKESDYADK